MKDINEIRDWLLENAVDEDGDLMLIGLDFSDFDGQVFISSIKTGNNLIISHMKVQGDLYQNYQEVKGDMHQGGQQVQGNLYNRHNKYGGNLYEEPSTKLLREITAEELEKMGYKIKEIDNEK